MRLDKIILTYLEKYGECTATRLYRRFNRYRAEGLNEALYMLIESKLITYRRERLSNAKKFTNFYKIKDKK